MRGEVEKKVPKIEIENMTSQEDDVVQKLCILGIVLIFCMIERKRNLCHPIGRVTYIEIDKSCLRMSCQAGEGRGELVGWFRWLKVKGVNFKTTTKMHV